MIIEYTLHIFLSMMQTYITYLFLNSAFKEKSSFFVPEKISYVLYLVLRLIIKLWFRSPLIMTLYSFSGIFFLSYNYKSSLKKRVFYNSLIFLIFAITNGLAALVVPTYNPSILAVTIEYSFYASMISKFMDVFIIFVFMFIRKIRKKGDFVFAIKGAMIATPLSSLFVLILVYEANNIPIVLKFICILLALGMNIVMFYIFNGLQAHIESEWKARVLEQQTTFYENELNLIQKNLKNIRILKHDLQNHISVIFGLIKQGKNEECIEYLEEINSLLSADKAIANSGNIVIDSIINFKIYELEGNHTQISVRLKIPSEINIPSFDIVTIVGNLIDNAIEGAMTVSENRFISVSITQTRGMLNIKIQNSFDGVIKEVNGKRLSRKRGFTTNGTGMERVSRVIDMYKGLLEYDIQDNQFTVNALLYIPQ
ncbi:GHKL domain-containing protein [Oscillospiraceae bacterium PP1C4]